MSNKMLLALFVVGATVVGTIALRNKTSEDLPHQDEPTVVVAEIEDDMVGTDTQDVKYDLFEDNSEEELEK